MNPFKTLLKNSHILLREVAQRKNTYTYEIHSSPLMEVVELGENTLRNSLNSKTLMKLCVWLLSQIHKCLGDRFREEVFRGLTSRKSALHVHVLNATTGLFFTTRPIFVTFIILQ
jgi:hypothetical protein